MIWMRFGNKTRYTVVWYNGLYTVVWYNGLYTVVWYNDSSMTELK